MRSLKSFFRDQSGSVTLDWVALTAGIVVISIAIVYNFFAGSGDAPVNQVINGYTAQVEQHSGNIENAIPEYRFFD